jgi:nuclear transport factor 2 (NTF2) superfamily protein
MENKKLIPPFDMETAAEKLQVIENAWNTCDPERVSALYTTDTEWRDRTKFVHGRGNVKAYLTQEWEKELGFKIKKELWGAKEHRMAVRFEYEWHDRNGQWYHSYGVEVMEFDPAGLVRMRFASISDLAIGSNERQFS